MEEKTILQCLLGVVDIFIENLKSVRGLNMTLWKWKILRGRGLTIEIPFVVGVWIFSGNTLLLRVSTIFGNSLIKFKFYSLVALIYLQNQSTYFIAPTRLIMNPYEWAIIMACITMQFWTPTSLLLEWDLVCLATNHGWVEMSVSLSVEC